MEASFEDPDELKAKLKNKSRKSKLGKYSSKYDEKKDKEDTKENNGRAASVVISTAALSPVKESMTQALPRSPVKHSPTIAIPTIDTSAAAIKSPVKSRSSSPTKAAYSPTKNVTSPIKSALSPLKTILSPMIPALDPPQLIPTEDTEDWEYELLDKLQEQSPEFNRHAFLELLSTSSQTLTHDHVLEILTVRESNLVDFTLQLTFKN